jgi:hypothetical protein
MCYYAYVMLRGRCSCAISERPTPSLFALPSLFPLLSPTIPVHPRNAPVSPIIPVHTQKQGGGGIHGTTHRSIPGIFLAGSPPAFISGAGRCNRQMEKSCTVDCRFPLTPTIPAPSATAALRVVPSPIFTTTLRIHVGAPTFSASLADRLPPVAGEQKDGPYTSHQPRVTSHEPRRPKTGANFHSRLSLVVHTPLYAEVPRIQEHAHE